MITKLVTKNLLTSFFPALIVVLFATAAFTQSWNKQINKPSRFKVLTDFNDQAVLDKETGLVWESSVSPITTVDWFTAVHICYNSNRGGRMGWRLPTVEELSTLVDRSQPLVKLPTGHPFVNVQEDKYWTANTIAEIPDETPNAWTVNFGSSFVEPGLKQHFHFIWCVRGGQGYMGQ